MYIYFSLPHVGQQANLWPTGRVKVGLFFTITPIIPRFRLTGWRGNFLLSAAEQWLKLELTKNFKACLSVFLDLTDSNVPLYVRLFVI